METKELLGGVIALVILKEVFTFVKWFLSKGPRQNYFEQMTGFFGRLEKIIESQVKGIGKVRDSQRDVLEMTKKIEQTGEKNHSKLGDIKDNVAVIAAETANDGQNNAEAHRDMKVSLKEIDKNILGLLVKNGN